MKRLVLAIAVILVMVALAAAGCTEEEALAPEGEAVASSCVTCHTDKDTLKEVATPEAEEATSEATSGEG